MAPRDSRFDAVDYPACSQARIGACSRYGTVIGPSVKTATEASLPILSSSSATAVETSAAGSRWAPDVLPDPDGKSMMDSTQVRWRQTYRAKSKDFCIESVLCGYVLSSKG